MSRKKRLVPNIGYLVQFDLFGLGFDEVIGISDVSVPLTSSRCADTQNELNVLMSRRSFKLSGAKNNVSNLVLCSWPNFKKLETLFLFVLMFHYWAKVTLFHLRAKRKYEFDANACLWHSSSQTMFFYIKESFLACLWLLVIFHK